MQTSTDGLGHDVTGVAEQPASLWGRLTPYVRIARPDHWPKHIFIIPGIVLAVALTARPPMGAMIYNILAGLASACLIASANYVINEWLDAETDKHHPEKKLRPSCTGQIRLRGVVIAYAALLTVGLSLAATINLQFLLTSAAFVISGLIYNVPPIRTKDRAYVDVLSESLNNPIRLALGWSMVQAVHVPPLSVSLAFLFGGAFLMATKRLSEYRHILLAGGRRSLRQYRTSFQSYNRNKLLVSCFVYAITTMFLMGVFLVKYRVEFIFTLPLIVWLFSYYLLQGMGPGSVAQEPEKLLTNRHLRLIVILLAVAFIVLSFVDLPWLDDTLLSRSSPSTNQ